VSQTGFVNPGLNALTKLAGLRVGRTSLEQGHFLAQILGLGFDVSQAGLTGLGMDAVVGGVGVSNENAVETLAKKQLGRFCRAVGVKKEEGQLVVPPIPNPVRNPIVAPGSFVAVSHGQGADFIEQVGIERQAAAHGLALKTVGAGGNKLQAEEVAKELADFAGGNVEFVTQVDGGGFGGGARIAAVDANTAIVLVVVWLVGALAVAALFTERAEISG